MEAAFLNTEGMEAGTASSGLTQTKIPTLPFAASPQAPAGSWSHSCFLAVVIPVPPLGALRPQPSKVKGLLWAR